MYSFRSTAQKTNWLHRTGNITITISTLPIYSPMWQTSWISHFPPEHTASSKSNALLCQKHSCKQHERVTPLKTTADQARDDTISGTITTEQDGWFVLTIPYDMGFTATVDGNPIQCEQVNLAFLGFPLSAGTHEIMVMYHAPGTKAGMACTIGTGFVVLGFLIAEQQRKRKQIKFDMQNKGD